MQVTNHIIPYFMEFDTGNDNNVGAIWIEKC